MNLILNSAARRVRPKILEITKDLHHENRGEHQEEPKRS